VRGANTGLDGARPVGIFLDAATRRVYVTTDFGQSVVIFDADELEAGGNVPPRRVIKGTKTLFGQATKDIAAQSRGPYAVTVVGTEAFVATPGSFSPALGLTPLPSTTVFNVSAGADPVVLATDPLSARTTNIVPDRALINPLLGASAVALDPQIGRLYVAGFDSNMILVYDDPQAFATGQVSPDRILAGPSTRLDHPVALLFRRQATSDNGSLYVVNQSSHSVSVFSEGDGSQEAPLLAGDRAPARYIGPPDGTDPFSVTANVPQMVFPTGVAIDPGVAADPNDDILYVSNRDAESFQDLVGRRIVAFQNATTVNGAAPPTWKIEGDRPPAPSQIGSVTNTDKTTLKRPAGLWLIPDPNLNDATADDRLVVANRDGKSVLIFRGLRALVALAAATPGSPPEDNRAPTWTITYSKLLSPFGVVFDVASHFLYVSDLGVISNLTGRILAFDLSALDTETPAPALVPRVVEGANTGLYSPLGIVLDPQD
jgi:DNA-binding beta-propeller fold protein YncE